jgi:hypothetical protein
LRAALLDSSVVALSTGLREVMLPALKVVVLRPRFRVWKRGIQLVVLSTLLFQALALGPRSGVSRKVSPPAQAMAEPSPPRVLAGAPFSRVPLRPERSEPLIWPMPIRETPAWAEVARGRTRVAGTRTARRRLANMDGFLEGWT